MNVDNSLTAALAAFDAGFAPIPVRPGTKKTAVRWDPWLRDLSKASIERHYGMHPDHDLGIIAGERVLVLDADTPEGVQALKELEAFLELRPMVITKTKRGEHHYFGLRDGVFARSDAPDKAGHPERFDVKTGRALVVTPPSPGKTYARFEISHVSQLTALTQEEVDAIFRHNGRSAPRPQPASGTDPDSSLPCATETAAALEFEGAIPRVKALLSHIDPDLGYQDWFRVAASLHAESGGSAEAFNLFDAWSARGTKYPGRVDLEKLWQRLGRYAGRRVTLATLAHLAREHGANLSRIADEHIEASPFENLGTTVVDDSHQAPVGDNQADDPHLLLRFSLKGHSEALRKEMAEAVPLPWDLALVGQWTIWFAPPNSGKTLIALSLCINATSSRVVDPECMFYLNADDSSQGITTKVGIAEQHGFHMVVPGYRDFRVKNLPSLLVSLSRSGQARGTVVVLDTQKKFTSVMNKEEAAAFGRVAREFITQGGTLLVLAHTNKRRDADGKLVYAGTTDALEDADCAFVIDILRDEDDRRTIQFENIKARGPVARKAAFEYSTRRDQTYAELLGSVRSLAPADLEQLEQEQLREAAHPQDLVGLIEDHIQRGYTTKMQLVETIAARSDYGQHRVRRTLEALTGDDPLIHRWRVTKGEKGRMTYELLPAEPPDEDDFDPNDDEDVY
ncbi:PriCT-2 domain-containing protein [Pseudohaliea sp.]|uniref:PriCT-2 domain-containing protein n=1 Tax=Pseudohaliea sp. TaxID=2740289 RepID=UPI0032EEF0CA